MSSTSSLQDLPSTKGTCLAQDYNPLWAVHTQGLINVGAKDLAPCLIWDMSERSLKLQSSLWDLDKTSVVI